MAGERAAGANGDLIEDAGRRGWWERLEASAVEKGALDGVDLALMRTLARRADRPGDAAFRAVLGCLIAAVRSGGLRIPIEADTLRERLEDYLRGIAPAPSGTPATAPPVSAPIPSSSPGTAETATLDPGLRDWPALARRAAAEFTEARLAGAYAAVLGGPEAFLPLIHAGRGLYFQKHHAAEAVVVARLKGLLAAPDQPPPPGGIGNILDTVLRQFPLRLSPAPDAPAMEFDPRQQEALALALRKRFTVISGGPGTGKTSLAANLLRAWTRAWPAGHPAAPRIRLAAPTGRAAQRLSESVRRSLESVRPAPGESDPGARADGLVRDLACGTLHSLLRYNPGSGEFFHRAHRPLPADLVLLDEVSMVDIFALASLLDALEEGACLVLLGDMDQLPSVEAGSVLADLVPAPGGIGHPLRDHLVLLDRSHRSEARILDVTHRINAMDGAGALAAMAAPLALGSAGGIPAAPWPIAFREDGKRVCPEGGCRMLLPAGIASPGPASGPSGPTVAYSPKQYRAGWDAWLEAWINFHYLDASFDASRFPGLTLAAPRRAAYADLVRELCALPSPEDPRRDALLEEVFAYLDQARILTLTRKGWHGAANINRRIRERLARRWDPRASPDTADGTGGFAGSPILILENDHAKGLFNGDVGIQLRIQGRDLAFFRRADRFQGFAAAFLPRHETAFAMTVHKSQGSEYDYALVVLPEAGNRLLYKETLYTALTRARLFAGIYGPAETFLEAVARKVVRESGLPDFLGGWREA